MSPYAARLGYGAAVALAVAFLALPVLGLLARAPWARLGEHLLAAETLQALRLSLLTSAGATLLDLCLGLPLAVWLAGPRTTGRALARALLLLPMVLPPVVGGVALLLAYGRRGLVGGPLHEVFGVGIPFTWAAVVLAQAYMALPFLVFAVEAGVRAVDPRLLEAADTLGAGPAFRFRRVTLPLVAPALLAGLITCWARALGEFGATITFAGSLAGETRTLPLAVYLALETDPDAAMALSLVLVGLALVLLVLLRRRWLPGVA